MVKATIYQYRDQITPVRIEIALNKADARIDMRQGDGGKVEISSDDPTWLEELEGAIHAARLHLESRGNLRAVS